MARAIDSFTIFFSGLDGLIQADAASTLAAAQGGEAVTFRYTEPERAISYVGARPGAHYYVVGFSAGAQSRVMGTFMRGIRQHGYTLPIEIMTVGLYEKVPRYIDPQMECINYLDETGQGHAGEHDCVNLGYVPHLGPNSGMWKLAGIWMDKVAKSV